MQGAVLTRFASEDYKVFFAPALYTEFLEKVRSDGLEQTIDDTKPGLLYRRDRLESYLWITGIASTRADRIGTPIRFNLLLKGRDTDIREWIKFFLLLLSAPSMDGIGGLGKAWDSLITDNQAFRRGVDFSHLYKLLENICSSYSLPPLSLSVNQDFAILSPLVPEASFVSEVLTNTSLQGSVWVHGQFDNVPQKKNGQGRLGKSDSNSISYIFNHARDFVTRISRGISDKSSTEDSTDQSGNSSKSQHHVKKEFRSPDDNAPPSNVSPPHQSAAFREYCADNDFIRGQTCAGADEKSSAAVVAKTTETLACTEQSPPECEKFSRRNKREQREMFASLGAGLIKDKK